MSVHSPLSFHSGNTGSLTAATAEEILGSVGAISWIAQEPNLNRVVRLGHDCPATFHSRSSSIINNRLIYHIPLPVLQSRWPR